MTPCPLILTPIFKHKIWGGRLLYTLLDKVLPEKVPIGESWECADLPNGQSIVARGPMQGRSLADLVREWGRDLIGRASLVDGRFPLLIKFLDATENLSIQVHPNPNFRNPAAPAEVKHEAWHVLHATPGAVIYRGLAPGVSTEQLRQAAKTSPDQIPAMMRSHAARAGQTYFIPSGTLHALGAGVVVAEIQTPSDTTHRLYDWGRTRPDGDAGLHIDEALAAIETSVDPTAFERRSHVAGIFTTVTRLVDSPSFRIEKVRMTGDVVHDIPYAELVCWIVLEGSGEITYARNGVEHFRKGDVVILPAGLQTPKLKTLTDCTWLEVTIPIASDLAEFPHPTAAQLADTPAQNAGLIPLNIAIKKDP